MATIAGRGYRFVAVISKDGESEIAGTAALTLLSPAPDRRHLIAGLGALGAAALVGTGAWLTWGPPGSQSDLAEATAMPSLAVLPFVNMSDEAGNEPFADGLSEEVLNVLAGIQGLKVAGRTSSFYFKNKSEKPDVIAATLSRVLEVDEHPAMHVSVLGSGLVGSQARDAVRAGRVSVVQRDAPIPAPLQ